MAKTFTIDDFVKIVLKYVADNEEQPISDKIISGIVSIVPDDYKSFLPMILNPFTTDENPKTEEALKAFIKACYYGPNPESPAYSTYQTPEDTRQLLYMTMVMAIGPDIPELQTLIQSEGGRLDENGNVDLFYGYLICNECGSALRKSQKYYYCNTYSRTRKCSKHSTNRAKLIDYVISDINKKVEKYKKLTELNRDIMFEIIDSIKICEDGRIIVKYNKVNVIRINGNNYILLTDLARYVNPEEPKIPIQTWMRNKNVVSFLGLWEQMHNSNFKGIEFETFNRWKERGVIWKIKKKSCQVQGFSGM